MNKHFTFLTRRGIFFCGVLSLSLLLTNCSNDDDQVDPDPDYEFGEDFDEVEDLPEVSDEDPEFEEPETGSVESSEDTDALVGDLNDDDGEVSEESQAKLNAVSTFNESLPATTEEAANNLDDEQIESILDSEELDADLESLETALDDVPEEVASLLPVLNFDFDTEDDQAQAEFTSEALNKLLFGKDDIVAQSVNGDCIAAAEEEYDDLIADLQSQRDTQLGTIENNYERRLAEAGTRYEDRLTTLNERRDAIREVIRTVSSQLLAAAVVAEDNGNTSLSQQLRLLSLFYVVDGRSKLRTWYTAASERISNTYENEQTRIEEIKDTKEAEVMLSYEEAEAEARTIYNEVTASCHNQGSGN